MKNLTVIIPIVTLDESEIKLFIKAVDSVDDTPIIVVGNSEALNSIKGVKTKNKFTLMANTSSDCTCANQINMAVSTISTDYFSVLEFDDTYNNFWFKNVEKYLENEEEEVSIYLPLTELIDTIQGPVGYANEAVWASSFSDEIGYYDIPALEDYLNFSMSGGVFKTSDFTNVGGLKPSIKLSFWYEFMLRSLYKGKRIYVIPKIGCNHVVGRSNSLSAIYGETMSEKEAEWWIDLAKKEYFFPHDRNKVYKEE
jgi:hypothetical protein